MNRDKFSKPRKVDGPAKAFGGDMAALLPPYPAVPDEFKRSHGNQWTALVSTWFCSGLPAGTKFNPKPGIDPKEAVSHVRAILTSWEPKHEHKEAGAAYLMSKWFESVEIPGK